MFGPETWHRGGLVRGTLAPTGQAGVQGSGLLTGGRRDVEVGCKAMDVAADRDALIGNPKGAEHRHLVVEWWGAPWQGRC